MSSVRRSGNAGRAPSNRSFLLLCVALVLAALAGMALATIAHAANPNFPNAGGDYTPGNSVFEEFSNNNDADGNGPWP